jgi:hypothetical protein
MRVNLSHDFMRHIPPPGVGHEKEKNVGLCSRQQNRNAVNDQDMSWDDIELDVFR